MDANSKDAEIRARVSLDMLKDLKAIAKGRGEQVPVIVREAIKEYLAKRAASAGTQYPEPGTTALLQILNERPEVANSLIALGRLLSVAPPPQKPPGPDAGDYGGPKKKR